MPSMTIQSIIDRAAEQADMHDDFVRSSTWINWYNDEARALEIFILRSGWVEHLATTVDGSSGTGYITVPSPQAIIGVYEVQDGKYRPLEYEPQPDFTRQSLSTGTDVGDATRFSVLSSASSDDLTVHLYPRPSAGTYRCLYIPTTALVTAVDDTVRWPLNFELAIVLNMAIRALIKEESDPRGVAALRDKALADIEAFCWSRVAAQSPVVRNVDGRHRGWANRMTYGPYESWIWR